jgi:TatD DNase family protein
VVDTHCHLDVCEPPVAELVARAARPASSGWPRSASTAPRSTALAARRARRGVAIVGRHPHETAGFDDARSRRSSAPPRPRGRAIGETGLDYYRDYAPARRPARAFEAQLELAARSGCRW